MSELRGAAFLDRDGTIIDDVHYIARPELVRLRPDAGAAIARLNRAGIPVIIVTNQSGIARGLITQGDYEKVAARMTELLARNGACRRDLCVSTPSRLRRRMRLPKTWNSAFPPGRRGERPRLASIDVHRRPVARRRAWDRARRTGNTDRRRRGCCRGAGACHSRRCRSRGLAERGGRADVGRTMLRAGAGSCAGYGNTAIAMLHRQHS